MTLWIPLLCFYCFSAGITVGAWLGDPHGTHYNWTRGAIVLGTVGLALAWWIYFAVWVFLWLDRSPDEAAALTEKKRQQRRKHFLEFPPP